VGLYENKNPSLLEKGLGIADILLSLGLDNETLASALIYPALRANEVHVDSITDYLNESSHKLLHDVLQMQSLGKLQNLEQRGHHQQENLRKMLLAMVTDVRAVLVILAERLWELRHAKHMDVNDQIKLAKETLTVYAPLANRLGVWQLKWEIEDLCLRYLHADIYKDIAKKIASKRDDRETYIKNVISILTDTLKQPEIKQFQISGRVKHIYSIYKKMQRKNANLEQIYDMSAIRVLVESIEDCYAVLSVLQTHFQQIPEEFDDYINYPKPNGYRSIHMVLIGPENHFVEVQIRTNQMHQESELGVAAHWRYKEGVLQAANYEAKIALLRQIMEWQKEVVSTDEIKMETTTKDLFADRIYVFTPNGDIIDLPKGATPLDFAYSIHSEIGHRCRGAKIDGSIVPLTYELQMGQRVEILTAKQANPSRDWVIPRLGFLKSARARARVQHWFRVKDSLQNAVSGRELLVKQTQPIPAEKTPTFTTHMSGELTPNIQIVGINNLLTHVARCCKPLPGDAVVGYVTRNRGVSIHRRNCSNVRNITKDSHDRMIEVGWGEKMSGAYPADLWIKIFDRTGLLRDITTMLASEKINVLGLKTQKVSDSPEVDIYLTIEITNRLQLKSTIEHLQKLPNIIEVKRR
jgi:GTP pyrophosphokinase